MGTESNNLDGVNVPLIYVQTPSQVQTVSIASIHNCCELIMFIDVYHHGLVFFVYIFPTPVSRRRSPLQRGERLGERARPGVCVADSRPDSDTLGFSKYGSDGSLCLQHAQFGYAVPL